MTVKKDLLPPDIEAEECLRVFHVIGEALRGAGLDALAPWQKSAVAFHALAACREVGFGELSMHMLVREVFAAGEPQKED